MSRQVTAHPINEPLAPDEWRACSEEMPDSDELVLIYHPAEDTPVYVGYHDGADWRTVEGALTRATHWMALPEPPARP